MRNNICNYTELLSDIDNYFRGVEYTIFVEEESGVVDIAYVDFKPVKLVNRDLLKLLHTNLEVNICRKYSEQTIKEVLYDMYKTYSICGFCKGMSTERIMTLNEMVASVLAKKAI